MDFMGTVDTVENCKIEGEIKRENDYGKGQFSEEEKQEIYKKYVIMVSLAVSTQGALAQNSKHSMGVDTLVHYLDNSGTDFELSYMYNFITLQHQGRETYQTKSEEMSEYFINTLKEGESLTLVTKNPFISHESEIAGYIPHKAIDWFVALGQAGGYMVATAKRNGDSYEMKIRYLVFDYYDWQWDDDRELILGYSNAVMWKMTSLGIAKPFFVYGEIIKNIELKK